MAETVIDLLEMIEIDEGHRQGTVIAQAGAPLHLEDLLAAVTGKYPGQVVADRPAQQGDHIGQLAHAGQAGDPGNQDQQPEGTDEGRPVEGRPVHVPGDTLGHQQDGSHQQVFQQREGKQCQTRHQHEGQEGIAGSHCGGQVGQLVMRQQRMRTDIEQGGNGEQEEHRQVGIGHVFLVSIEQQQTEEGQAYQQTHTQQLRPQRKRKGQVIDHPPQRSQHSEQQGKQPHPVNNEAGAVTADQQRVTKGCQQFQAFAAGDLGRQETRKTVAEQAEERRHGNEVVIDVVMMAWARLPAFSQALADADQRNECATKNCAGIDARQESVSAPSLCSGHRT